MILILAGFMLVVCVVLCYFLIYVLGKNDYWVRFEQKKNCIVADEKTIQQLYGLYVISLSVMLLAAIVITIGLYIAKLIPVLTIFSIIIWIDVSVVYGGGYLFLWLMNRNRHIPDEALKEYEYKGNIQFAAILLIAIGTAILAQVLPPLVISRFF